MFSLIITIVSIALVAALALATIYYGGDAFTQGQASADASRVLNQGQQILAAAEMYKVDNGTWPTVEQLVADKYLKSAPMGMATMGTANAQSAGEGWTAPTPGQPVYVLAEIDSDTCQAINETSYSMNGILEQARTTLATQCYGTIGTGGDADVLKVIVTKSPVAIQTVAADLTQDTIAPTDVTGDAIPLATDTAAWTVAPDTVVAGGGTGGGVVVPPVIPETPGSCASLTHDVNSPGGHILTNTSGGALTLTAFTGYHRTGALVGTSPGNFGFILDSFPTLPGMYDGNSDGAHYENMWQNTTQAINVTWPAGYRVIASGQAGNVDLGTSKGAVFVQEFNSWCAWGVHNPGDVSNPYGGTGYFVGVDGPTWNAPNSMDGAWGW